MIEETSVESTAPTNQANKRKAESSSLPAARRLTRRSVKDANPPLKNTKEHYPGRFKKLPMRTARASDVPIENTELEEATAGVTLCVPSAGNSESLPPSNADAEPRQPMEPIADLEKQKEIFRANAAGYLETEDVHIEELAYHVYGEIDGLDEVSMKPPEDFNESMLPKNTPVTWSYETTNRIVRVDFTGVNPLPREDLDFVTRLMQRDDLVVITAGLTLKLESLEKLQSFLDYLGGSQRIFHKFRRFQRRENSSHYDEMDGHVAMTPQAFVSYLESRNNGDIDAKVTFQYFDTTITVGVQDVLLYMIDADVPQLHRQLEQVYKEEFRWGAIYPGGSLCMMKDVPSQMQPFMGPNLYVTPGSTYTSLHQDGLGTVDSGHSNLFGTNEVIMLRRLPEVHKRKACALVPLMTHDVSVSTTVQSENTLYRMPHDDGRIDKPQWPDNAVIDEWRKLKAGEHLHINKGRLHSFRKMSSEQLPKHDCHHGLRAAHLKLHPIQRDVCVSIAFDWMFLGADCAGINREIATILENAGRIRSRKGAKTLAIVETSLFAMAETVTRRSLLGTGTPSRNDIARGILPALEVLVRRVTEPVKLVKANTLCPELQSSNNRALLSGVRLVQTTSLPDADQNPVRRATEPYGNDYTCKLCDKELPNLYFHCEGCEMLLKKDYNICRDCFTTGAFLQFTPMRDDAPKKFSDLHHTGQTVHNSSSRSCPCKQGLCLGCKTPNLSRCRNCSCICHKKFSARYRFRDNKETIELLQKCKLVAGDDKIPFFRETVARLDGVTLPLELRGSWTV